MTHWFYAVMTEENATWSTALRARSEQSARAQLAQRYPHATVFTIER